MTKAHPLPEKLRGVYCLLGEPFLRDAAVAQTIRQIKQSAQGEFSETSLEGDAVSLEKLAVEMRVVPLFEAGKILRIRHADELQQPERVLAMLARGVPPTVHLLFEADRLDKRGKFYKFLEQRTQLQEFARPDRRALPGLIKHLLQQRGLQITPAGLQYFMDVVENDLGRIVSELGKLSCYPHTGPLDVPLLKELLFCDRPSNVFAFLDAWSARDPQTLNLMRQLLDEGEDALKLFFLIVGHVRSLLTVKSLSGAGFSPEQIAARSGKNPWLVNKQLRACRDLSEGQLIDLVYVLQREDLRLKQGEREPDDALLYLALRLAQRT